MRMAVLPPRVVWWRAGGRNCQEVFDHYGVSGEIAFRVGGRLERKVGHISTAPYGLLEMHFCIRSPVRQSGRSFGSRSRT